MALLVNDKTNASYRFPANTIGTVSTTHRTGALPLLGQWPSVPMATLAGIALSGALLYLSQRGLLFSSPLLIGIVAAYALTRFCGIFAGAAYVCGWLGVLYFAPSLAIVGSALTFARGWEAGLLYFGAVGVGSILNEARKKVTRLQHEQKSLHTEIETAQTRQQLFLRDILTAVTAQRLTLCESSADLPALLPFAPGEEPVPLASAMLSEVRARIRKAGASVGLSESVTGDLVIAGSEAALNAVVHATGGVAEIRADERGCLQIWVRDSGTGIDDAFLHRAILEAGFSSKGTLGQGFSLIVSTCHRVYLLTSSTGTTVVLETETPQRFALPA
ncbi:MAG: sensor histidine kinase [Armatimonadetes bacterium]|nr:sensor histidine kinase [Armatimonadota bacterium]